MAYYDVVKGMLGITEGSGLLPFRTSNYGDTTNRSKPHDGEDYIIIDQNGNPAPCMQENPDIHSPVEGVVWAVYEPDGMVIIYDEKTKLYHALTHLDSWNNLKKDDVIKKGDIVGTMGGRLDGIADKDPKHLDYRIFTMPGSDMKDAKYYDPKDYWNFQKYTYDSETEMNNDIKDFTPDQLQKFEDAKKKIFHWFDPFFKKINMIDPLVLDLNDSNVMFDLDGDNFKEKIEWVAPEDGVLVLDKNGNGRIDDINELFGTPTVSGFEKLKELDSNNDGVIDANDAQFSQLKAVFAGAIRVWQDVSQAAA